MKLQHWLYMVIIFKVSKIYSRKNILEKIHRQKSVSKNRSPAKLVNILEGAFIFISVQRYNLSRFDLWKWFPINNLNRLPKPFLSIFGRFSPFLNSLAGPAFVPRFRLFFCIFLYNHQWKTYFWLFIMGRGCGNKRKW